MSNAKAHVLAYPFPSSGHLIPLLDLAKALVSRGVKVTLLITPSNQPLVPTNFSPLLQTLLLPKPESLHRNSNQNGLITLINSMRHHHSHIILDWARAQARGPNPPSAIISDFFLSWTNLLARDLHVPRILFSTSGAFVLSLTYSFYHLQNDIPEDPTSVVSFSNLPNSPAFPTWQITRLVETTKHGPEWEFHRESVLLNMDSWGIVFNTFTELERVYLDYLKKELGHERIWAIGPVLPLHDDSTESRERGGSSTVSQNDIIEWLNSRAENSVIYVCFGSRTFLTSSQMEVLTRALELSEVNFILSVRVPCEGQEVKHYCEVPRGFNDRVRERGLVIEGWAPQLVILRHGAVGAFLTHCGWNSVLEGLVSGVVMMTWPMDADQFSNAKLLMDELGVAVRAAEGEKVPEAEELARRMEEVLGKTKERVKAKEIKESAIRAIGSGGSSHVQFDALVKTLS